MGRHKKFDRDEAIEFIIQEIWRNGYEVSSVKALSEKLGITRSSFYNAFGSREELFIEVLEKYCSGSPDAALNELCERNKILPSICAVFREACSVRSNDPDHKGCLAVNSVMELVGTNDKLGPMLSDAAKGGIIRFENLLKIAHRKGEFECKDIKSTALALQSLLMGINVTSMVEHDGEALWKSTQVTLEGLGIC